VSDAPLVQSTAEAGQPVKIVVQPAVPEHPTITDVVDPNSEAERSELIPTQNWETDPMFYELANYLNVDSKDYGAMADKVSVITEWAIRESNSNKSEDLMHTIRGLEEKLQPPEWGVKRINHIYNFLRMESQYSAHKKALGAYSRTGKWGD